MFLNGVYNGVYNLSEQVDKRQLKLKSYNGNIRGELYKGVSWGASTFTDNPNYDNNSREWSGYEMKYPKEDEVTNWQNLYEFTEFVLSSSESDFTEQIWNKFNYDNYLNYFIFLNLLRATDNTGKNIYIAKYNIEEPYFYIPWDLDGCFGTIWDGRNENITNDILANGLQNRILELDSGSCSSDLLDKWNMLRANLLTNDNLINLCQSQFQFLSENKIYERESLIYPNYSFSEQDLDYLVNWIQNRLAFLDDYFYNLTSVKPMSSNIYIYPNPSTGFIHIMSSNLLDNKTYKVYNLIGQLIDSGLIKDKTIRIDHLKMGNYLIYIDQKAYKLVVIK